MGPARFHCATLLVMHVGLIMAKPTLMASNRGSFKPKKHCVKEWSMHKKRLMSRVGFEPTPSERTTTWTWRLRPLGHLDCLFGLRSVLFAWRGSSSCFSPPPPSLLFSVSFHFFPSSRPHRCHISLWGAEGSLFAVNSAAGQEPP